MSSYSEKRMARKMLIRRNPSFRLGVFARANTCLYNLGLLRADLNKHWLFSHRTPGRGPPSPASNLPFLHVSQYTVVSDLSSYFSILTSHYSSITRLFGYRIPIQIFKNMVSLACIHYHSNIHHQEAKTKGKKTPKKGKIR
jgi:hypothetical protein